MSAAPDVQATAAPGRARGRILVIDALAARYGGTAYAVLQLVEALERRPEVTRVHVVTQRNSIIGRGVRVGRAVRPLRLDPPRRGELAYRVAWEAARLPGVLARSGADLLVTCSGMLPRRPGTPYVSLLANPVPFIDRGPLASRLRRAAMARTSAGARAVYVPSTHMVDLVGAGGRVRVVPLGVDRTRFRPADPPGDEVLYVGDFYAHKRHDLAIAAWRSLPEPRPLLRLIGNPAVDPAVFERVVRAAAGEPGIVVAGRVSFDELLAAYRRARVLLLTSTRESFSMPLAEAICAGVPALHRDDPVLRETAGPGGVAVPGDDPAVWADRLRELVHDDALHARVRAAGLDYGRRYSWDILAGELIADAGGS